MYRVFLFSFYEKNIAFLSRYSYLYFYNSVEEFSPSRQFNAATTVCVCVCGYIDMTYFMRLTATYRYTTAYSRALMSKVTLTNQDDAYIYKI